MNIKELISESDLLEWTGYTRVADVTQWLAKNGIEYAYGYKRRICTTLSAVNHRFINKHRHEDVEFDFKKQENNSGQETQKKKSAAS